MSQNCLELAWVEQDLPLALVAAVAAEVLAAGVELPLRTVECAQQASWLPKESLLGSHTLLPPPTPSPLKAVRQKGLSCQPGD